MIVAKREDKPVFLKILSAAFDGNKSSEWVARATGNLEGLMSYGFDKCVLKDGAYFSDDKRAAILIDKPDIKLPFLKEFKLSFNLATKVIGLGNVYSVMKRESYIKQFHPEEDPYYYAWFLGVNPADQGKGFGTTFIEELFQKAYTEKRGIYLETSNPRNLPLYQRFGFEIYHEWNGQGFPLWFLRKLP